MLNHTRTSPSRRFRLHAGLCLLACAISFPLLAARGGTSLKSPPPSAHVARSAIMTAHPIKHRQSKKLTVSERPPLAASRDHFRVDYDRPESSRPAGVQMAAAAAGTCDVNALGAATGSTLVSMVRNASVYDCINTLFSLTGSTAGSVFGQAKMVTIADALRNDAASYAGNNDNGTLQLVLFLRAGYYVQYYDPSGVGNYGTPLKNAIRPALDAFVANSHFKDVTNAHGSVLTEFVTLIDSAGENARHLGTVKGMLDRYNSSYHGYWDMMSAANGAFTVLFRGHYNSDFVSAVQSDPSITSTLSNFISRNAAEAGTDNEYLLTNAGRELARFLQYPAMRATTKPLVRDVLSRYSMSGTGAGIWIGVADVADYYLPGECSYFNICNFRTQLEQVALPITHQCNAHLTLRAQQLTSSQITEVCSKVINMEDYFHQKLNTHKTPVANDNNTSLELVIFDSSNDYGTYAGVLFGIDTNNGGMYLEGDPSVVGNQARFIAYEAEWLRPTFDVWNLTHEYVHYLDGRFNMHGDFGAAMSQPTVWWVEGLAEYISYGYRGLAYSDAIARAGTREFPLSSIYYNDYNSGTDRVYRWGYLAVRYMFEKQPAEVSSILGYFRPGNYTGYGNYLASIRNTHDSDWNLWLTCLSANQGDSSTCGGTTTPPVDPDPVDPDPVDPDPVNLPECATGSRLEDGCKRSNMQATRAGDSVYHYIWLPAGTTALTVSTSGGTGDVDLYVSGSTWPTTSNYDKRSINSGNSETVSIVPSAEGRYYYITAYAKAPFAGVTLVASTGTNTGTPPAPTFPECTGANGVMTSGCQRSNLAVTRAGDTGYFYIWVPNGTAKLRLQTHGGTGNADLYVSGASWPSTSSYQHKSTGSTNAELVEVNSPTGGSYYYVAVVGATPYSGVTLSAQLTP